MAIKQEYYLKRNDGTIFKGSLELIRVEDTDRDAFEVEGLKGRYIISSTDIPVKGFKRSNTPDDLIEQFEEVGKERLDAQEAIAKVKAENAAAEKAETTAAIKDEKKRTLVKFFQSGDLYNKNKDLFIFKEGFDPESVG